MLPVEELYTASRQTSLRDARISLVYSLQLRRVSFARSASSHTPETRTTPLSQGDAEELPSCCRCQTEMMTNAQNQGVWGEPKRR
jgi:hypothetical protein